MISFKNYIKADIYKFYHSKLILLHILVPIIGIIGFILYSKIYMVGDIRNLFTYIELITIIFPLIIAIIINNLYEQEEEGGSFQYFLTVPENKYKAHLSKIIITLFLGLISTLMTFLVIGLIYFFEGYKDLSLETFIFEGIILFGSNIIFYLMEYLIVFFFGKVPTLTLGVIGTLLTALMATGLGDIIWPYSIFGYGIRNSIYFLSYKTVGLVNSLVVREIKIELIMISIFLIVIIVALAIFIKNFEGRKHFN
ncbi:MAG: lantibiotic immunity ABC transporter MutG family permease subunit [Sarcina sp.]